MVRVLHVVSSMNRAGIENALMNYYRNVDRNKVQFDFLMAKTWRSEFDDEIEELGGRIYRIPMTNPMNYIKELNKFFKTHKEYKICHLHHLPWGALTLAVAKSNGVPTRISHVHFAKDTSKLIGLKQIMRWIAKRSSNNYFACGKIAGERYFGNEIIKKSCFRVLNNAIDTTRFNYSPEIRKSLRERMQICDNSFVIGQVARLRQVKNPKFTVDVLESLLRIKRDVDFRCMFVGDGDMKEELEAYAKEKDVFDKCIFIGSVGNPQDYMQAMDILMFPSINEGLGMVAVEAQSTGLRCLASTGVPRECAISPLVSFMSLSEGPDKWAEFIIKNMDYERRGMGEEVKKAGYDVGLQSKYLQDFYMNS